MLSVVIPCLNAARHLPECLAAVAGADEVIVVDGGSTDGSAEMARDLGVRLIETAAGRGAQLSAGAEAAGGEWLLFVHADTVLGPEWRGAVNEHVLGAPEQAGCFRLKLDDDAWQARLVERAVAIRVVILGIPYGDQALLISRALYDRVGGFRPLMLMEDVDLVSRIGRGRMRALGADALTSAERWRSDGWFRRSARNLACLAFYLLGGSPERIARFYDRSRSARA